MKKVLLSTLFVLAVAFNGYSQNSYCHTFDNITGLGEYDPSDAVSYSVAGNELTIVFTNAILWGSNEVKIEFPSVLDLSGASGTNIVSLEAKVTGSVEVTGGGCTAGTNYIPFGFHFYDNSDNYTPGFSTSESVYATDYDDFTASTTDWGTASNSSVKGIAIKPADPGNGCTSGTSVLNGTIVIRNLNINNGTCTPISTPVTSFCGDFSSATGISEYDPDDVLSHSVASNELTIEFDNAVIYGNNEVKIEFPSALDLSAASTTGLLTFDVQVSSPLSVTGGGCETGVNFIPLGFNFYDNSGDTYADGFTSAGIFDETGFVRVTVNGSLSGTDFDNTAVKGIAFKPADPGQSCTSGTSVVSGEIKIKNLGINSSTCGETTPPTSVHKANNLIRSVIFPNPSSELVTVELGLKNSADVQVTLSDAMGKTVLALTGGNFSDFRQSFSVTTLQKGLYTVTYTIDGSVAKAELLMVK